jgi:beta-galactosidase
MKHNQGGKHGVSQMAGVALAGGMLVAANGTTGAEDGATLAKARDAERETISLDGQWQIAEGSMEKIPETFDRTVPVPGLVDMAVPSFEQVGKASPHRQAYWYKKTFTVSGHQRAVATLKIAKAMFGMKIWVNGIEAGEEVGCYAPGVFDVTGSLRCGAENTLIVRVGSIVDALPASAPFLWNGETPYKPAGIYDGVTLSLMDSPYIVRVQVAPDIKNGLITVQLRLRNVSGTRIRFPVKLSVREWKSGRPSGTSEVTANLPGIGERIFTMSMKIDKAHLWSPEDPFLYVLRCETGKDNLETRFGMREFHFDPESGWAMLNGERYYLLGCSIRMTEFFADPNRGALPWDREWVRKLLTQPKDELNWNSMRVFMGRPPEFWYDLADEIGWLLQDGWPMWGGPQGRGSVPELTKQYKQWVEESWNHPSIVVWEACNETRDALMAEVVENVRRLDLSNRPWDNSYLKRTMAGDPVSMHAYTTCAWSNFETYDPPWDHADLGSPLERTLSMLPDPVTITEIDTFWIGRDGSSLNGVFDPIYKNYAGRNATREQRRECQAYLSAAVVEYWRARRDVAGIMGPMYLDYNDMGLTSHNFLDLANLVLEPHFADYTKNAYSPLAVMIDDLTRRLAPGSRREYRIIVTNDDSKAQKGVLELRIMGKDEKVLTQITQEFSVKPWEQAQYVLPITLPSQPGEYRLVARLCPRGTEVVLSRRNIQVVTPEEAVRLNNLAIGCAVTASSELAGFPAKFATDGKRSTYWSSEASDPQWLTVDLGRERTVGAVSIDWSSSIWEMKMANSRYTKQYEVQVSMDNQNWAAVAKVDAGNGGRDLLEFKQATARYVRIYATARGVRSVRGNVQEWQSTARGEREAFALCLEEREGWGGIEREGYDIWELEVFEK